jgi:hypothetical protein
MIIMNENEVLFYTDLNKTKVRKLRKLGTSLQAAISVANKPAKGRGDYPGRRQRKRA